MMTEDETKPTDEAVSEREQYELEHLCRKYGLLPPLAKTAPAEASASRTEAESCVGGTKHTGA